MQAAELADVFGSNRRSLTARRRACACSHRADGRALVLALDDAQRTTATIQGTAPNEIARQQPAADP